jgi:cleavage and polyadenylation specificity factor subunit 1
MNYLYTQECMGEEMEGCTAGYFIHNVQSFLTYNRNIIRLWRYDGRLVLVKEQFLFERVLGVEGYRIEEGLDGVIFLFDRAKVTLARFNARSNEFEILSLKYFEREEFNIQEEDVRIVRATGDVGMLKISKCNFALFPLLQGAFGARALKFADVSEKLRNVIDFVFLYNYSLPTVCVLYDAHPTRYTSARNCDVLVFSIDLVAEQFHVVDEFSVPPLTFKVECHGNTLMLLSPNLITMRSTSSCYTYALNRMAEGFNEDEAGHEGVVLYDALAFYRGNTAFIFNGNGETYKLSITTDIRRIIKMEMSFGMKDGAASCLGVVDDLILVGSTSGSPKLYRILSRSTRHETEHNAEYLRLFGSRRMDLEEEGTEEEVGMEEAVGLEQRMDLEKVDELWSAGACSDLLPDGRKMLAVTEGKSNEILVLSDYVKLDVEKAVKIKGYKACFKAFDLYFLAGENENNAFTWDGDLVEIEGDYATERTFLFVEAGERILQITRRRYLFLNKELEIVSEAEFINGVIEARLSQCRSFLLVRDVEQVLMCYNRDMSLAFQLGGVRCFADIPDAVFVFDGSTLGLYDFKGNRMGESRSFSALPGTFEIMAPEEDGREEADQGEDGVVEICATKSEGKTMLLVRSFYGIITLYESGSPLGILLTAFHKVRFPGRVLMEHGREDAVFHRLRDSVFIGYGHGHFFFPTDRGCFLNKSQAPITALFDAGDRVLQLCRGSFAVCRPWDAGVRESRFVVERHRVQRRPKFIENAGKYKVMASCEDVPFTGDGAEEVAVYTYRFFVELYSGDYSLIGLHELEPNEMVFDIKYLLLNDKQGNNGKSHFLVVCTTFVEGEDRPSKGRLHVFELISIVPEPENPFKDCKLKLLGAAKTKGAILQCEEIRGNIALCIGTKIMIYKVDRSEGVIPIGFHDLHTFTSSISVIKNYILASDIYRGLTFFYLQSRPIRLTALGCSGVIRNTVSVELLPVGDELSMLCCDASGVIHIYTYSPHNMLSLDGTKLVKRAEIRTKLGRMISSRRGFTPGSLLFCSRSNICVEITGLEDMGYYKLLSLQNTIMGHVKDTLGLRPSNFLDADIHLHPLSLRTTIVAELLSLFCSLDLRTQQRVCESAGMTKRGAVELLNSTTSE